MTKCGGRAMSGFSQNLISDCCTHLIDVLTMTGLTQRFVQTKIKSERMSRYATRGGVRNCPSSELPYLVIMPSFLSYLIDKPAAVSKEVHKKLVSDSGYLVSYRTRPRFPAWVRYDNSWRFSSLCPMQSNRKNLTFGMYCSKGLKSNSLVQLLVKI